MPEPLFPKAILKSPLSDDTKNERRNLLVASAIGIIIVKTGLIPTKISALGIEFSETDKTMVLKILAWIMIYLTISFSIYALSDFVSRVVDVFLSNAEYAKQTYKEIADGMKEQLKIKQELDSIFASLGIDDTGKEELAELFTKIKNLPTEIKEQEIARRGAKSKELAAEDRDKLFAKLREMGPQFIVSQAEVKDKEKTIRLRKLSKILFVPRLLLDYLVPLGAGVYTIVLLFRGH